MSQMSVSLEKLTTHYARRDKKDEKWKDVEAVMKGLPGTPCCVQMSRAFCGAGLAVPSKSFRPRWTAKFPGGLGWRALLATDEVEEFLAEQFLDGENLRVGEDGLRTPAQIKAYISGTPGVIVFRHGQRGKGPPAHKFEHTEIWNGEKILQRDMAENALFSSPRVLFWPTGD
jgi:hypothetical protein